MSRILIADDQNDVLQALRILLKGEGHQTDAVTSLAGVFQALEKKDYALLIMDLNYTRDTTSGQEGLEVIPRIQALDNTLPIVVMTAWATIDLAVEAMNLGARDFIPKPWDNDRLLAIVRTQIERAGALRKGRRLTLQRHLRGFQRQWLPKFALQLSGGPTAEPRQRADALPARGYGGRVV